MIFTKMDSRVAIMWRDTAYPFPKYLLTYKSRKNDTHIIMISVGIATTWYDKYKQMGFTNMDSWVAIMHTRALLPHMACPFPKYLLTYKSRENDTHIIMISVGTATTWYDKYKQMDFINMDSWVAIMHTRALLHNIWPVPSQSISSHTSPERMIRTSSWSA